MIIPAITMILVAIAILSLLPMFCYQVVKNKQHAAEARELKNRLTRLALAMGHPEFGYGWISPLPGERAMNVVTVGAGGGGGSGRVRQPSLPMADPGNPLKAYLDKKGP